MVEGSDLVVESVLLVDLLLGVQRDQLVDGFFVPDFLGIIQSPLT